MEAYSDSDFAGDTGTRRFRTGVLCNFAGTALSWLSQRQKSVALSTTEAEYVAANEAAKQIIWLKRLYNEIAEKKQKPILYIDNLSTVRLTKNPEFHRRSKHIEVRYHFVRERFQEGCFDIQHISGENQIADLLTKELPKPRFTELIR